MVEFLDKNRIHPTADDIYQALAPQIPTLSKTTIYNTMKIFVEKGLVIELVVFENEVRYEYNIAPHAHFKCIKCGKILDVETSFDYINNEMLEGHKILQHHINLKGVCKKCLGEAE